MIFKHGKNKKGLETTTAIMFNTSGYAQSIVAKRLGISKIESEVSSANNEYGAKDMLENTLAWSTLEMNHKYTGTVTCDERDKFDVIRGEALAREKALNNMKQAANSRIVNWQAKILEKLITVSERGFNKALDKAFRKKYNQVLCDSRHVSEDVYKDIVAKLNKENPEALKKAIESLNK